MPQCCCKFPDLNDGSDILPAMKRTLRMVVLLVIAGVSAVQGQERKLADERVLAVVRQQRQPFIETLRQLVGIESGSRNIEGLNQISDLIASRLRALGGEVELITPGADAVRFEDTPQQIGRIVVARF